MDLSTYYEELQSSCNMGDFTICFAFCVILFLVICRVFDKSASKLQNIGSYLLLGVLFVFFIVQYFNGVYLAKKDIEQQTILCYEGHFEIVETTNGWINDKLLVSINGQEIVLKYFEDEEYDYNSIKPGNYEGTIVYAQHLAELYYFQATSSE